MFDFTCTGCGTIFEELVFGDEAPACPKCGAATQRQMSVPSPLKTGAFPFKPGPVRPMSKTKPPCAAGGCPSGGCGTNSGAGGGTGGGLS